jgi:tetratricopeptide (TPR) repeat protein
LRREAVFNLSGLARPNPPYDQLQETWEQYPAVRLFTTAVQRVQLDFIPQDQDWPLIGQICDLTKGHPLALELAASWRRFLSCAEIVHRLQTTADLPEVATDDVPTRQRSLTATFDYSWELLTAVEQASLLRLAVFKGPFRPIAATEIADVTLPELVALVDKSLLQLATSDLFDSHPLLRQYIQGRLAHQPTIAAPHAKKHADYYRQLVNRQAQALDAARQAGSNPRDHLQVIRSEIDNVRGAWEWYQHHPEALPTEQFVAFVDNFGLFLAFESWYQEALTLYTAALATLAATEPDTLTAGRWVRQVAIAHLGLGDARQAEKAFRHSLNLLGYDLPQRLRPALLIELLHQLRYRILPVRRPLTAVKRATLQEVVKTFDSLSRVHYYRGQSLAFAHSAVQALNIAERLDEKPVLARHYANLCIGLAFVGRHRWSRAYRARARAIGAELDDAPSRAYTYLVTGVYDGMVGNWEQSQKALRQASDIYEQLGDMQQWGECQAIICTNLFAQGQFHTAVPEWEKLSQRAHRAGNRLQRSWGNTGLAGTLLILDETDRIPDLLHVSRTTLAEIQSPQNMMSTQAFWSAYQVRQGAWREALQAADTVFALAQENKTTFTTIVVALGNTCETYLHLLEQEPATLADVGTTATAVLAKLDNLTTLLQTFAHSVTAGLPRACLYRGLYLKATGQSQAARKLWQQGLAQAQRLRMPYEEARLGGEIAKLEGDNERVRHTAVWLATMEAKYDATRYQLAEQQHVNV